MQSCDVYFYEMALRVGIDKISDMAASSASASAHDLPMSAVAEGLMPDKAWKRARCGAGMA